MSAKFELASKEWLEELFRLFREVAKKHPEVTFSVCEVFTQVPRRLNPDADGHVAWHGFVRGGEAKLAIGEVAPEEVDIKTVGEWEAIVPLARHKIDLTNAEEFARYQKMGDDLAAQGKVLRFGDRTKAPLVFVDVHNSLAERTA